MWMIIVVIVLMGALVPLAVLTMAPSAVPSHWLSTHLPFTQALAFPLVLGAGCLCVAGVVAAVAVRRRRSWAAFTLMLAWLLVGSIFVATGSSAPGPSSTTAARGRQVTVVTFNSQDTVSHDDIAAFIAESDPDIIVLPEAGEPTVADAVRGTPFASGIHMSADAMPEASAPTALLVHPRLGAAGKGEAPSTTFGSVAATIPGGPTIVGVHTAPPLAALMSAWRGDVERLSTLDRPHAQPLILAGDFNATLRHGWLAHRRTLVDAGQSCGIEGTWPVTAPRWLRTPIDHVLVSPEISVQRCRVRPTGRGDHAALIVELVLPQ